MSLTPANVDKIDTSPFVTVTHGMRGYFAVHVWHNPDMGGFWEPYESGIGSYATPEAAAVEAQQWASDMGIRYVPRKG